RRGMIGTIASPRPGTTREGGPSRWRVRLDPPPGWPAIHSAPSATRRHGIGQPISLVASRRVSHGSPLAGYLRLRTPIVAIERRGCDGRFGRDRRREKIDRRTAAPPPRAGKARTMSQDQLAPAVLPRWPVVRFGGCG